MAAGSLYITAFLNKALLGWAQAGSPTGDLFQNKNLDWFPRMRAMSLVSNEGEGEQNEIRILQDKLNSTMKLVSHLTAQLNELKEQVCTQPYLGPTLGTHTGQPLRGCSRGCHGSGGAGAGALMPLPFLMAPFLGLG